MKKYAIMSLMTVLALGACDDDDPTSPPQTAEVRVVNAAPGTPSVNVVRDANNASVVSGVGFQTASSCSANLRLPAGSHTIKFRTPGSTTDAATRQFDFQANQRYTIVLYGPANNLLVAVLTDEPTPGTATTNNNRIRFINATNSATAADIFATTAGGDVAGTPTAANIASGTGTTGAIMYQNIANTNVRFRLFNTGTTTGTPRGDFTFSTTGLPGSRNSTIVFTDAATTGGATAFQVNNCS